VQEVKAYSAWRPDRYGAKFIFFLGPTSSSSWGGVKDCSGGGSEPDNPFGIPPHSPAAPPAYPLHYTSPKAPPAQLPASSTAPFEPVAEPLAAQEELIADSYNSQATTLVMGPATTARVFAPEDTDEDAKSESSKPSEILELCGEAPLDLACFESFSRLPSHFVTETVNAARVLAMFTITWATCFSGSDIAMRPRLLRRLLPLRPRPRLRLSPLRRLLPLRPRPSLRPRPLRPRPLRPRSSLRPRLSLRPRPVRPRPSLLRLSLWRPMCKLWALSLQPLRVQRRKRQRVANRLQKKRERMA
jgi:hypothetical protein